MAIIHTCTPCTSCHDGFSTSQPFNPSTAASSSSSISCSVVRRGGSSGPASASSGPDKDCGAGFRSAADRRGGVEAGSPAGELDVAVSWRDIGLACPATGGPALLNSVGFFGTGGAGLRLRLLGIEAVEAPDKEGTTGARSSFCPSKSREDWCGEVGEVCEGLKGGGNLRAAGWRDCCSGLEVMV